MRNFLRRAATVLPANITRVFAALWGSEDGTVSVITVVGIMLLSGIFALSVDVGSIYLARERLQAAVDLAALKAVTDRSNATALAQSAVEGNMATGYLTQPVSVTTGRYPPTGYTLADLPSLAPASRFEAGAAQPNALRIAAEANAPLFLSRLFYSGQAPVAAQATAYNEPLTQITIGTGALAIDSSQAAANDMLLSGLLGTSVTLNAVSYQGLLDANVRLFDVLDALASIAGTPSGDYEALFSATVSYAEVIDALNTAVLANPDLAGVATTLQTILNTLRGQVSTAGSLVLGDFLNLDSNAAAKAAGSQLSLYAFLRAAAEAANMNNATLAPVNLAIAGGTVTVHLAVIEPTQVSAVGGEGISVQSAQIRMYVEVNPTAAITVLGNVLSVRFPVLMESVAGQATVTSIACSGPDTATATVDVTAQAGPVSVETADIDTTALHQASPLATQPAELAYAAGVAQVTASGSHALNGNPQNLTFTAPFDSTDTQRVSLTGPLQLVASTLVADDSYTVSVLGIPFPASVVTSQLTPILNAVAPAVDTLFDNLLKAMGAETAYMDVTIPYLRCSNPVLAQ